MWWIFFIGLGVGTLVTHLLWQQRFNALDTELRSHLPPGEGSISAQIDTALQVATKPIEEVNRELAIYHQLLSVAPLGYVRIDSSGYLLECNTFVSTWFGLRSSSAPKRMLIECVRSLELEALVSKTRKTGHVQQSDLKLSSVQQDLVVTGTAIPLANEQVGLFLLDRSEVERLIQQRDRWVGDVAHELKTPLTSIRLVAEVLLSRVEPSQQQWLERLLREVERLNLLIRDLLELSQWEARTEKLVYRTDVDLVTLLYEAWQTVEPIADRHHVTMTMVAPDHLLIDADGERLYRVFLNLLDNAVRYSPENKAFVVRLVADLDAVHIEFTDNGPGFPPQDLDRVFERFYRADPARARQTGGTGLGLAIVRQIVEAHGGTICAANHPQTGGAWLRIDLPQSQPTKSG
jgi:two-component system, OmpR family, phosphate regulon sensor histidine kinase PhoR